MDVLPIPFKALDAYPQFIIYKLVSSQNRPGKNDKYPINYLTTYKHDAHDPAIWMDATQAIIWAQLFGKDFGVGFVVTEVDPIGFLDIDNCLEIKLDINSATPIAKQLLKMFAGAAIEISSSGKGLHIIFSYSGKVPAHKTRDNKKLGLELYTKKRLIALTGIQASGNAGTDHTLALHALIERDFTDNSSGGDEDKGDIPKKWLGQVARGAHPNWKGPLEDEILIERMLKSKSGASIFGNKASFRDLWECNTDVLMNTYGDANHESGYNKSSADAGLASHLAFWTGSDCERMLRIMNLSELRREKWDVSHYLKRTILFACKNQKEFLNDKADKFLSLSESALVSGEVQAISNNTKFKIIPASVYASLQSPPWLIKDVLPQAEVAMLFGASSSAKTFFTLDMAIAIARGTKWYGHKVNQGRVVYIAAEGAGGLGKRLNAYSQHHNLDLSGLPLDVIATAPNFLDENDVAELSRNIGKAALIILDTLARINQGGDENSGSDMGKILAYCKSLHVSTQALILLVHHTGKDSSRGARGWSGLRAAVDAEIEVMRLQKGFQMQVTKLKDGENRKIYHFKLLVVELGFDEDKEVITSCVIEPEACIHKKISYTPKGKHEKNIICAIKNFSEDGKALTEKVMDYVVGEKDKSVGKRDQKRNSVNRALTKLIKEGHLVVDNEFISICT